MRQPSAPEPDAELERARMASPLIERYRGMAVSWIQEGRQQENSALEQRGWSLLRSGELPIRALLTNVMERPGFLGRALETLRREERVRLLDNQGAWYLVLSPRGNVGWVHANRLFPREIKMVPGETGSGSTRGEVEIGGRG